MPYEWAIIVLIIIINIAVIVIIISAVIIIDIIIFILSLSLSQCSLSSLSFFSFFQATPTIDIFIPEAIPYAVQTAKNSLRDISRTSDKVLVHTLLLTEKILKFC